MPHASEADSRELPRDGEVPLQFGKYRLSRLLARGGMGEVYLARLVGELGFEKRLVIKTILPELAAKKRFIELFAAEAKTAVALSHGNIVPTYELGRTKDTFYIVMGYVDGPSVAQMLVASKHHARTPDLAVAMHVIRGVLAGLAYAHHAEPGRAAVVHRDITPRNILLDRSGQVRIVDFGIAAPAKAEGGVRAGSTGFVAPEQARGDVPDPRADVFSAGCLLYELCTFQRAFPKRGVWLTPDLDALPEPLREPTAAALAFEPDDRPRDANALLGLLRPAINEYAHSFDDQAMAAFIRDLFPEGWSHEASGHSGVNPIRGFDNHAPPGLGQGDNETFATRLTSVTGMNGSQESPAFADETDDDRPARSITGLEPRRTEARKFVFAPLLLGAAAIGALALAFGGDDEEPPPPKPEPVVVAQKAAPPEPAKIEPEPEREPVETEPEPEPEPPPVVEPRVHRLAIDPADADVVIDGRPATTKSPHAIELPREGKLVVEVRKAGYEPRRFELDPTGTLPETVALVRAKPKDPGFLQVMAPGVDWAEVRIDGRKVGATPTRKLTVTAGRHKVEVRCIPDVCPDTRVLLSKTIVIEPNSSQTLKAH